jgi:hypothetical protein
VANNLDLAKIAKRIWRECDLKKINALDKIFAFRFINRTLKEYEPDSDQNLREFDAWFD